MTTDDDYLIADGNFVFTDSFMDKLNVLEITYTR